MDRLITIINPSGGHSSIKKAQKTKTRKKEKTTMAAKRKSTRRRKATTKRRKRRNPSKHRVTVYKYGRGKSAKLRRTKSYRLKPKRVNPRRRRKYSRRRNPVRMRQYFGKTRMTNAISLLVGIGGAAGIKAFASRMVGNEWFDRTFGILAIIMGATLNMRGRRAMTKSVGTGMVVFGLYDAIVSNVPMLGAYLPTIGKPSFISGYSYGRSTYPSMMGASVNDGDIEVVGANVSMDMSPEIVGTEMDLADALEMAA